MSLEFVLKALAAKQPENQPLQEWKRGIRDRLGTPTITLQSYGGGELNIVSQMMAPLSKGEHRQEGVVQVQKGAPMDLLIGTDVQPKLGFLFLETKQKETAATTDLLSGKAWSLSESEPRPVMPQLPEATDPISAVHVESPVVHLIQATQLPARHAKLVRAQIDCQSGALISLSPSLNL